MAEPIRKPAHRPRPPHPHARVRPHATVLVRSRIIPEPVDTEAPLLRPVPPVRPALVRVPEPVDDPTPPAMASTASTAPAVSARTRAGRVELPAADARSSRSLLLAALALHLGVLLTTWLGQATPDLGPADLALSGVVLGSGGMMLLLAGLKRPA